jgi:LmbE family N-acetylglucosaminyl deacetylase
MKAGAFRDAWGGWPIVAPLDVTGGQPFMVISPHPDDESLGVGGLIAASRQAHVDVRVVMVTDGARSHPTSKRFPRDRLVALRRDEASAAANALGLGEGSVTHLDLPDAEVPLSGPAFEAAVALMAAIADECRAASVFVTWGRDPHCDHEAAEAMARVLKAHRPDLVFWSYPIWGWHLDPETEVGRGTKNGRRVDVEPWLEAKRRAIAAHVSQMTDLIDDDPEGFRFSADQLAPFLRPIETVFEMDV